MIRAQYDNKNRNWWFRPLQRALRGRFLLDRVAEPTAMAHRDKIPVDVPGLIVAVDRQKREGYLIEPIHDHPKIVEWVKKIGKSLDEPTTTFENIDPDEWLFFIDAANKAGKVQVEGVIPDKIDYTPPKNYLQGKSKRGQERLAEVCRDDPATAAAYVGMDSKQRKEFESLVGV